MKRAQNNFERDPRKKFFCERNPTGLWKQKITNKVRDLIIIIKIKKTKPGKKKKKVGKFDETRPKKIWARSEKKKIFASETLRACESKKLRTSKFAI